MDNEFFGALADLGIRMGSHVVEKWFRDEEQTNPYACMDSLLRCSAQSTAKVFELVGVAASASQEQFAEVSGMFLGSATGAIAALTKLEPNIDAMEELAERIFASAYEEMQKRARHSNLHFHPLPPRRKDSICR